MFDQSHPCSVSELFDREKNTVGWDAIDPMFGDRFFNLNGVPIRRGDRFTDEQKQRLPVVFDNKQKLCSDLIPVTSWGSSLANILVKNSWDALRHPLIAQNHRVCQVCGKRPDVLDVHEIWEYLLPNGWQEKMASVPEGDMIFAVQRLAALWPVCQSCHECFHLGLANIKGRSDIVLARLAAINLWSNETLDRYSVALDERRLFHDQFLWALDLSHVADHPHGGITIKPRWQPIPECPDILRAPSPYNDEGNVTVLCNVPWRILGDSPSWRPSISISVLYD